MLFSVPSRTEPTLLTTVTLKVRAYIGFSPFSVSHSHSQFLHPCFLGSPFNKLLTRYFLRLCFLGEHKHKHHDELGFFTDLDDVLLKTY